MHTYSMCSAVMLTLRRSLPGRWAVVQCQALGLAAREGVSAPLRFLDGAAARARQGGAAAHASLPMKARASLYCRALHTPFSRPGVCLLCQCAGRTSACSGSTNEGSGCAAGEHVVGAHISTVHCATISLAWHAHCVQRAPVSYAVHRFPTHLNKVTPLLPPSPEHAAVAPPHTAGHSIPKLPSSVSYWDFPGIV